MSAGDKLRGWLRGAFMENWAIKFVSLVLSVTIFILVNSGQDVDIGVTVPVRYIEPKDRVLVSERVDQVRLSIRGSWRRTKRFDDRQIDPIVVDLRGRSDGLLVFQEDMIRLPHGLELRSIVPQSTPLRFEPRESRSVPINVRTVGTPAPGFHLVGIQALQPTVTMRGARSELARVERVETTEVAIDGRDRDFTTTADLVNPTGVELADKVVPVRVQIAPDEGQRVVEGVAVHIRPLFGAGDLGDRFIVEPAQVVVTLHGTEAEIQQAVESGLEAYVKLSPEDPAGRAVEVLVRAPGVGHEVVPREVTVVRRR